MKPDEKRLYKLKADLIAALGHPIRLAIVEYLRGGEQCVCDISDYVGAKRSNVSRHLAVLLQVGIVDCRKDGLRMIYSLRTPCLLKFLSCVTEALRQQIASNTHVLRRL
jgi:ArsR family transcriptional regulator